MYTECPECNIGFRVTAKVLQQAGGRVRCGGCGHAFSALDHLTENLPGAKVQDNTPPANPTAGDLASDEKFEETSRQLLKTLNELAGPEEVRIEDTGIEWQVLDGDEDEDGDAPTDVAATETEIEPDLAPGQDPLELEEVTQDAANEEHEDENLELVDENNIDTVIDIMGDEEDEIAAEAAPAEGAPGEAPPTEEEWSDLLEEVADDGSDGDDIPLEVEEELAAIHSELSGNDDQGPADLDSQSDMQAEAAALEIGGPHETSDDEEEGIAAEAAPTAAPEEDAAEEETAADHADEIEDEDIPTVEPFEESVPLEGTDDRATFDAGLQDATEENAPEIDLEDIEAADGPTEDEEQIAAAFTPDAEVVELSMDEAAGEPGNEPEYTLADAMPEQSEEEMTINQQIDEELLAIAGKDEDMTATIIGLDHVEKAEKVFQEESPGVETIIMEGDVVRGAVEQVEREKQEERRASALKRFDQAGNLVDSYIARRAVRGGRRATDPASYAVIAGVAILVMLLAGQVVHANRQSLSTSELFDQTFGQVYRLLGKPVTPQWSTKGWQFEATNGSVADGQDILTISSRIGNRSGRPLPYPLVHVSLTDRWEEIIGSAVLEPGDYLAGDFDPGLRVMPGASFTAVITIDEPSVDATGFKLNVCYRASPGRVRCATEDFKD